MFGELILESRIPEILFQIDDLVVLDLDAFGFEQLLHEIRSVEMVLSGEQSFSVHDAVRGHIFTLAGSIHRPADHACRPGTAEHFGNRTIGSDFSIRDLARDVVYAFKKIVVVRILSQNSILKY